MGSGPAAPGSDGDQGDPQRPRSLSGLSAVARLGLNRQQCAYMATTERRSKSQHQAIEADLIAVLVAIIAGEPHILTIRDARALPSGLFESGHRSLQSGLRAWVEAQTGHPIGYMEQLYTFADRDRAEDGGRAISISYLGLTRADISQDASGATWRNWYGYFPWEDHRNGLPEVFPRMISPRLRKWAQSPSDRASR